MKFLKSIISLVAVTATVNALPKVTRQGKYLYREDGTRFYVKVGFSHLGNLVLVPFFRPLSIYFCRVFRIKNKALSLSIRLQVFQRYFFCLESVWSKKLKNHTLPLLLAHRLC